MAASLDPRRLVPRTEPCWPTRGCGGGRAARAGPGQAGGRRGPGAGPDRRARRPTAVADAAVAALPGSRPAPRPVINATGVVLHTNLGRASLSAAAIEALASAAGLHRRRVRPGHRAPRPPGPRRAGRAAPTPSRPPSRCMVVNNGAAALVLATTALAAGREVVVSRGEMVEIGDGFRLPDLIASTGARLREVGTTNRTTAGRLRGAPSVRTPAASSRCIRATSGSRASPPRSTSPSWPRSASPVVVDIGSGLLAPDPLLPDEPDADTALRAGAAVVTASGDKLLGGPQAGLLLGASRRRRAAAPPPAGPRAARRQADPGRARGDPARTGDARPGQALRADADALRARAETRRRRARRTR